MLRKMFYSALLATSAMLMLASAARAQVTVQGLDHYGVGDASVSLTVTGELQVDGLTSVDDDFVRVDVQDSDGGAMSLYGLTEGVLRVHALGEVGGLSSQSLGGLEVRRQGSLAEITGFIPDVPGSYVFRTTVIDDTGVVELPPVADAGPDTLLTTLSYGPTGIPDGGVVSYRKQPLSVSGSLSLGDGSVLTYTEDTNGTDPGGFRSVVVRVTPADVYGNPLHIDEVTSLRGTGGRLSAAPPLTMTSDDRMLYVFDNVGAQALETSPGRVRLDASPSGLTVSSSSSFTGDEGVRLRVGDLDRDGILDIVTAAREHGSGQATGRRVHSPFRIVKTIDKATPGFHKALCSGTSSSSGVLGEITLYEAGVETVGDGDTVLSSDFSLLGSSLYEVSVRQGGVVVASAVGDDLSLVTLHASASGATETTESLSLNYEEIKWTYKPGRPDDYSGVSLPGAPSPLVLNPALPFEVVFEALSPVVTDAAMTSVTELFTGGGSVLYTSIAGVPEPSSLVLGLLAAGLIAGARRRRRV